MGQFKRISHHAWLEMAQKLMTIGGPLYPVRNPSDLQQNPQARRAAEQVLERPVTVKWETPGPPKKMVYEPVYWIERSSFDTIMLVNCWFHNVFARQLLFDCLLTDLPNMINSNSGSDKLKTPIPVPVHQNHFCSSDEGENKKCTCNIIKLRKTSILLTSVPNPTKSPRFHDILWRTPDN